MTTTLRRRADTARTFAADFARETWRRIRSPAFDFGLAAAMVPLGLSIYVVALVADDTVAILLGLAVFGFAASGLVTNYWRMRPPPPELHVHTSDDPMPATTRAERKASPDVVDANQADDPVGYGGTAPDPDDTLAAGGERFP